MTVTCVHIHVRPKNTSHYLAWREAVKDMMTEPRYGVKYDILMPQKSAK